MNKKKLLYIIFIINILFKINVQVSAACVHSGYRCKANDNFIVYTQPSDLGDGIYEFAEQYSGNRVFCIKKGATTPAIGVTNSSATYCNNSYSGTKKWRAAVGYAVNRYNKDVLNYKTAQKIIHRISYLAGSGEDCSNCTGENLNRAVNIYNNYGKEKLKLSSTTLTFTKSGNYYESNKIEVTKLEYFGDISSTLKINGTSSDSSYIKSSNGKLYIQIPKNIITATSTVELIVSSSYTYKLAIFNSCGGSFQPIARTTQITDENKKVSNKATGSIVVIPTYTFSYNANGGTGTMSSQSKLYGETLQISNNSFSKVGYSFTNWRVKNTDTNKWYCSAWKNFSDCNQDFNTYSAGSSRNINSSWNVKQNETNHSFVFYAQWTPNTYTITFDGNGHTGGSTASMSINYDQEKSLTTNGFKKSGYSFGGWKKRANGTTSNYSNKQKVKNLTTTNGDTIKLYAHWIPNTYTINFDGNGHTSGSTASMSMTYGNEKNLTTNGFKKDGHTFVGWKISQTGDDIDYSNKQKVKNLTTTNGGTITLYAHWVPNKLKVYYNANGGSINSNEYLLKSEDIYVKSSNSKHYQNWTYNQTKTKGLYNATTFGIYKTGYTFNQWSTRKTNGMLFDPDNTKLKPTDLKSNITNEDEEMKLYAQWTPNTYTINFDGNGHTSGSTESMLMTYDEEQNLNPNGFVKEGNKFIGWNTKKDNSGNIYRDEQSIRNLTAINGDTVTLYAQWDEEILPSVSIKKVNNSNNPIIYKEVSFEIYTGTGCILENLSKTITIYTGGDGVGTISLKPGVYSMKEVKPPHGYVADEQCIEIGDLKEGEKEISVINKTQCEGDFSANNSIINRLYLYKDKYPTYNNLLNFTITDATEACSNTVFNLTSSNLCLSTSRKLLEKTFDNTDLSAYNDTLFYNNKNHYCITEFELNGGLGNVVTSGQFVSTNNPLSKGTFTKTCYIHQETISPAPDMLTINEELREYIGIAKLDGKALADNISSTKINYLNMGLSGEFYKYKASYNIEYYPWNVYAIIGSGEVRYDDCSSCKYLGQGIISKFLPETQNVEIDFVLEPSTKNILKLDQTSKCSYTSIPEITIENNLQLEFRIIDTTIPFNRETKSNWCDGSDCSKNNALVESVIKSQDVNNSIDKTASGSLYTNQSSSRKIILTSELIQEIKEYNKQNPYDDYTNIKKEQTETGKTVFRSSFLEQFNIIKTR